MIEETVQSHSVHFQSGWMPFVYAALLAVSLLIGYRSVRSQKDMLSAGRFWILLLLRSTLLFLAVMFLARPVLHTKIKLHRKDYVAFLLDESGSMGVRDEPGGTSRWERARSLARQPGVLEQLNRKHDLRWFRFATTFREDADALPPAGGLSGGLTDIGQALLKTGETLSDRPLSGIVLLSDGANNFGENPLVAAKLRNVPVFPVELGTAAELDDIGVLELELPDTVYLGGTMDVKAHLDVTLTQPRRVTVRLLEGSREIVRKQIDLEPGDETPLQFSVQPRKAGLQRYTLVCESFPEEAVKVNNSRSGFVQVLAGKIKILAIAGRLSWDFTFLKRTLDADPTIDLRCLVQLPEAAAAPRMFDLRGRKRAKLSQWPAPDAALQEIDIVFLHGMTAAELPPEYTAGIITMVENRGGALVLLGGPASFSAGGYHRSPLADLIPLVLFEAPDYRPERFAPRPTTAGLLHPITTLVESATMNRLIWSDFPALAGLNLCQEVKRGATVLLERTATEGDPQRTPVAVIGRWGKGQVLAFCFEGFWRWDLPLKGFSGKTDWHQRFWTQAMRYLSTRKAPGEITVNTDKRHYLAGETAQVEILLAKEAATDAAQPAALSGKLLHVWPGATTEIQEFTPSPVQESAGRFRASLQLPETGEYVIDVSAPRASGTARVLAEIPYREFQSIAPDRTLLETMADLTGGRYLTAGEIGQLPKLVQDQSFFSRIEHEREIWSTFWILLLFVGAISAEWLIRKREGLE